MQIELGSPFSVKPDFQQIAREYDSGYTLQPVELQFMGGRALVEVNATNEESEWMYGSNLPAGPLETRYQEIERGKVEMVRDTYPLSVELSICALTEEELDLYRAQMILDGQILDGVSNYDDNELKQDGRADLRFDGWRRPDDPQDIDYSHFPHDPEIFSRMQLVLFRDS